ncbi:MAG: DUF3990 domain-containing protein [Bacteroidales bacterium]|nr:DUF3990 domain-containing protein [Bacteroidales bacterium]
MIVYHAATEVVEHPLCHVGRPDVDFGKGFYVTPLLQQAKEWAKTLSLRRNLAPVVNVYELNQAAYKAKGRCKIFSAYDEEWLLYVVDCRRGGQMSLQYDYIQGGVANDRVVDTIRLYMDDLIDIAKALERLSYHKPNMQICLRNQELVDKYLKFIETR